MVTSRPIGKKRQHQRVIFRLISPFSRCKPGGTRVLKKIHDYWPGIRQRAEYIICFPPFSNEVQRFYRWQWKALSPLCRKLIQYPLKNFDYGSKILDNSLWVGGNEHYPHQQSSLFECRLEGKVKHFLSCDVHRSRKLTSLTENRAIKAENTVFQLVNNR